MIAKTTLKVKGFYKCLQILIFLTKKTPDTMDCHVGIVSIYSIFSFYRISATLFR